MIRKILFSGCAALAFLFPSIANAVHTLDVLGGSSNFSVNIELSADQVNDTTAPTIVSIIPAEGETISNPPSVIVNFSEPVQGVTAASLFCELKAAVNFQALSSTQYLFEYAPRSVPGSVRMKWNPSANITDISTNKNQFVVPQAVWTYEVNVESGLQSIIINEILAINNSVNRNRQGQYSDWVELYNQGITDVDLGGCYLTDSEGDLTKWQFPENTVIKAGDYLLVYCDSWTTDQPLREYHANFSLNKDGEYLGLIEPDGETVIFELAPSYPKQYSDISFGNGVYYKTPTPGKKNEQGYGAPVSPVIFSEPAGYKNNSFTLELSTETEGASIYYTTDGTIPTSSSILYTTPVKINKITYIRAIAVKDGAIDSPVTTRTWLFMEEVLTQSDSTPAGWPASYAVNNHKMEYGMNSRIVRRNSVGIRQGMTNIATFSIVTDLKNLFDSKTGIYVNPGGDGDAWERPVSIELIDPTGGGEFQIDGGLRIRGAYSRSSNNPKHSLRFFFRDSYGGKLKFPLFGDEGADEFDKVDLRTSQNFSWSFEHSPYNTFIRETFSRDSQRDFGTPYSRSRYYHLYINGQYWGLYQTEERCDADYAKTYLGGKSDDWDCIKTSHNGYRTEASDGNMNAFTELYNIAVKQGFSGIYSTNYYWIKGVDAEGNKIPGSPVYLDEDDLMAYMLITYFTRDPDCPVAVNSHANNLYGLYNRAEPSGFKWFKHDGEHSMAANRGYPVTTDLTAHGWQLNTLANFNPMRLHQRLMDHPEYKMHWVDLVQKQMVNSDGALSLSNSLARWNSRQAEIDQAMIMESARWGHGYTRNDWITECNYVKDNFIVLSAGYLMKNFKSRGWFPTIDAPIFLKKSESDSEISLTLSGSDNVYYTTDGTDPRLVGGDINPFAVKLENQPPPPVTLIERGTEWQYFDNGSAPARIGNASWFQNNYSHDSWKQGDARLGFGSRSVKTVLNRSPLTDGSPIVTAYFAKRFQVNHANRIAGLSMELNVDDGAVVYINGTRVLLHNIKIGYNYSTYASSDITGSEENLYHIYEIDSKCLVEGENLIAVEVHQSSENSDDLYFDLELSTVAGEGSDIIAGEITVAPGTVLKSRCWNGTEWSAIAEVDLTIWASPSDLRVSEMMYAPSVSEEDAAMGWKRDDFAWLEFVNTGKGILNLAGIQITSGIEYTFPELLLYPQERVVLVKNTEAFSSRYDTNGMNLLSGYSGNLARKGETISIASPSGENILTYAYSNKWYPETDENGYSLVVVDTSAEEPLWSTPQNWKPSQNLYGSPGTEDGGIGIAPIIKNQPLSQWITEGKNVLFNVVASGSMPLEYQWYKDGVALLGEISEEFSILNVQLADAGEYTVQISNRSGSVISRPAVLKVEKFIPVPPSILVQPQNQSALPKDSVTFIVGATGSDPMSYQWYKNGIMIEGATRPNYTILEVDKNDQSDVYWVVVSNMAGTVESDEVFVTVMDGMILQPGDPIFGIAPQNSSYPSNENPTLAVDRDVYTKYLNFGGANAGFIVTPQLGLSIVSGFEITTANDVEGRDPASYAIYGSNEAIQSKDGGTGTAENWNLIATGEINLSSDRYTRSGIISFQNDSPYLSYKVIFPTLKDSSITMVQLAEFQFYGIIWQTGGPTISPLADYVIKEGRNLTLIATAMGTLPLSYQWYKDGIALPGETDAQLKLINVSVNDSGSYTLQVNNSEGTAISNAAKVSVVTPEAQIPILEYIVEDGRLILDFTGNLYESDDLQNWVPVIGATSPYVVDPVSIGSHYYLSVIE
ncbi:MAG: immunoglobulin domain-containing protein [Verrucomicrobia bacterium]|nr:immunoglobulin domain-containing protein [Verrucomicrobiota bacterium]